MIEGIWVDKSKKDTKYYFTLKESLMGDSVCLDVVNENGNTVTHVLKINKKTGLVTRNSYVNDSIGFILGDREAVCISDSYC